MVNNILGKSFTNLRWSMRQGDLPSVYWFAYGIIPLICYLDQSLQGIQYIVLLPLPQPNLGLLHYQTCKNNTA